MLHPAQLLFEACQLVVCNHSLRCPLLCSCRQAREEQGSPLCLVLLQHGSSRAAHGVSGWHLHPVSGRTGSGAVFPETTVSCTETYMS
jgi:hypothetical protein